MAAQAGFNVVVEDLFPSNLRIMAERFAPGENVRFSSSVEESVRDADFVIDLVPDELESKLEIFSMLDRMAPPRTILCTPSTALSIADLASCTYRPQLCFALRFADPFPAEITYTSRSSREALSAVEHWLTTIGFTVTTRQDPSELTQSTDRHFT